MARKHISHRESEQNQSINLPLLRKDRLLPRHWRFIMLCECQWSPLVFDTRGLISSANRSYQPLVNQSPATASWSLWYRKGSMLSACLPHNIVLGEPLKSALSGLGLEEVCCCSWEKSCEPVYTMCLHLSWEHTELLLTPCLMFPLVCNSVWLCMCMNVFDTDGATREGKRLVKMEDGGVDFRGHPVASCLPSYSGSLQSIVMYYLMWNRREDQKNFATV